MRRFIAVARGHVIGVYNDEDQAEKQKRGFSAPYSKTFDTIWEAERCILYMRSHPKARSYDPTCSCARCSKNEFPKDLLPIKLFLTDDYEMVMDKKDYSAILRNKKPIVVEAEINSDDQLGSLTPNGKRKQGVTYPAG